MSIRNERLQEALRETAAEFLAREAGPQSLITVTRAEVSPNVTHATIFISVLPEEKETAALGLANRSIKEYKQFLKSRVAIFRIPYIEFSIDKGEKNRQRLDELSGE